MSAGGDMDGDGLADLLVGTPYTYLGGTSTQSVGVTRLLMGPVTASTLLYPTLCKSYDGETAYDFSGWSVALPGDLDGDGYGEVVIGAPYQDANGSDSGATYVAYKPLSTGRSYLVTADARIGGGEAGDEAGTAVAGPGDLDGDGLAEVAMGSPYDDTSATDAGAVYLFAGSLSGLLDPWDGTVTITGEAASDKAGSAVAAAGDIDGDGIDDLDGDGIDDVLVGAPYCSAGTYRSDPPGRAYLFLGGGM